MVDADPDTRTIIKLRNVPVKKMKKTYVIATVHYFGPLFRLIEPENHQQDFNTYYKYVGV